MSKLADLIIDKLNSGKYTKKFEEYVTDSDDLTFDKFEKLIKNILNYDCSIEMSHGYVSLYLNSFKKVKSFDSYQSEKTKVCDYEEERLEISIAKDDIFTINIGYNKRSRFKKEGVYKHFYPIFKQTLDKMNNENFLEAYQFIMKESGLLRDENLNSIITD